MTHIALSLLAGIRKPVVSVLQGVGFLLFDAMNALTSLKLIKFRGEASLVQQTGPRWVIG